MDTPLLLVVNFVDHEKSNFDKAIEMAKDRFGNNVTIVQYPVNEGTGFNSLVDVLKMKMYKYPADGGKPEILDIPVVGLFYWNRDDFVVNFSCIIHFHNTDWSCINKASSESWFRD